MNKEKLIEECLTLFEKTASKQTYDMKGGITAVVEHLLSQGQSLPIDSVSQHSELLKEIFSITAGAWDDPVISEDLYNRMEAAISFNCG